MKKILNLFNTHQKYQLYILILIMIVASVLELLGIGFVILVINSFLGLSSSFPIFVEKIIGIFLKPLVLMIRLFANITAGHIIILSFFSMIFIFGAMSPLAGYGVSVFSGLFVLFMMTLELLVAFLQAYVFTLLAAMYFGAALEEH